MDVVDDIKYEMAISYLKDAVGFNQETQRIKMRRESIAEVKKTLEMLELIKMKQIAKLVFLFMSCDFFNKKTKQKIIPKFPLCASFVKVWDFWHKIFKDFEPIEVTGRISNAEKRAARIELFQEDNDRQRIMLLNPSVTSGFDLHCKTGNHSRIMIKNPGFNIMDSIQTSGRIDRDGVKGTQFAFNIFGKTQGTIETSILKAISRKGLDIKKTHIEQNTLFPNEFPRKVVDVLESGKSIETLVSNYWDVVFYPERWERYKKYLELSPESSDVYFPLLKQPVVKEAENVEDVTKDIMPNIVNDSKPMIKKIQLLPSKPKINTEFKSEFKLVV